MASYSSYAQPYPTPHFQSQSIPTTAAPTLSRRSTGAEESDYDEGSAVESVKSSDEFQESGSEQSERGWSSEGGSSKIKKSKGKGKNLVDLPDNYDADLYGVRRSVSIPALHTLT